MAHEFSQRPQLLRTSEKTQLSSVSVFIGFNLSFSPKVHVLKLGPSLGVDQRLLRQVSLGGLSVISVYLKGSGGLWSLVLPLLSTVRLPAWFPP